MLTNSGILGHHNSNRRTWLSSKIAKAAKENWHQIFYFNHEGTKHSKIRIRPEIREQGYFGSIFVLFVALWLKSAPELVELKNVRRPAENRSGVTS